MIKVKYILAHIILILFLSCNGSGGCNNLDIKKEQPVVKNEDKNNESSIKEEDTTKLQTVLNQNQIEPK